MSFLACRSSRQQQGGASRTAPAPRRCGSGGATSPTWCLTKKSAIRGRASAPRSSGSCAPATSLCWHFIPTRMAVRHAHAWRCDLWPPGATQSQWLEVPARGEADVPVMHAGVYSIGIGQADGHCPGVIGVWLRVPEPDRLALSLTPAFGSSLRYARRDDGAAVVHIENEAHVASHACLDSSPVHATPAVVRQCRRCLGRVRMRRPRNEVARGKYPSASLLSASEPGRCTDAGAGLGQHALRLPVAIGRPVHWSHARCVCSSWYAGRIWRMCGRAQRRPIAPSSPVPPMAITAWSYGCSGHRHGARSPSRRLSICACGALTCSVCRACVRSRCRMSGSKTGTSK